MVILSLQVAGTDSPDSALGVSVVSERRRYLFNVGEGTQRLCMEHHLRVKRVDHIFLSRLDAACTGGLPGMVLTVSDCGKDELDVYGPVGLQHFFRATRHFLNRPRFRLRPHELAGTRDGVVDTEDLRVLAVELRSTGAPAGTPSVLCYAARAADVPGKFDPKRAVALGLKKGPQFSVLTRGEAVTLEDGSVVRPEDVISPSVPGPVAVVVDLPDETYLPALLAAPALLALQAEGVSGCAVHRAPLAVLRSDAYVGWMRAFGSQMRHVVVAPELCRFQSPYNAADANAVRLNAVSADAFPLPFGIGDRGVQPDLPPELAGWCEPARPLLRFSLLPLKTQGFVEGSALAPFPAPPAPMADTTAAAVAACEGPLAAAAGVRLTFLGTGSAIPAQTRNVSAILLELPQTAVLMDAGEGTFGQMCRRFGPEQALALVQQLGFVWISHYHADHMVGLYKLLSLRADDAEPLLLMGPVFMARWLRELAQVAPSIRGKFWCLDNRDFVRGSPAALTALQLNARTVHVNHCAEAYGLVLRHAAGWSVVYSGDTRPCKALERAGRGATVLIHEATFDDSKPEDAVNKKHSTTGEAIGSGVAMGAHRVVLTHFSQRYPTLPSLEDLQGGDRRVFIAFDLLSFMLPELETLPRLLPALEAAFPPEERSEEAGEGSEKKRARKSSPLPRGEKLR